MKTADHFWTDPSADELVQRHRIHSSHCRQDSPTKRPALCVSVGDTPASLLLGCIGCRAPRLMGEGGKAQLLEGFMPEVLGTRAVEAAGVPDHNGTACWGLPVCERKAKAAQVCPAHCKPSTFLGLL